MASPRDTAVTTTETPVSRRVAQFLLDNHLFHYTATELADTLELDREQTTAALEHLHRVNLVTRNGRQWTIARETAHRNTRTLHHRAAAAGQPTLHTDDTA